MRSFIAWSAVGMLVSVASVQAQVRVDVSLPLPSIRFVAPPPVIVVEPGIQVVEDYDDEVFVMNGSYWLLRDGTWYRSPDYRGGWIISPPPPRLVTFVPGRYRHFRREAPVYEQRNPAVYQREYRREHYREYHPVVPAQPSREFRQPMATPNPPPAYRPPPPAPPQQQQQQHPAVPAPPGAPGATPRPPARRH